MTKTLAALALAVSFVLPTAAFADPQPQMKAALDALNQAKDHLEKGTTDKGGHRVKALELVKKAIEQTEKGINFDNKH